MSTNINAYFGAVDEALAEVQAAQAKLQAAEVALATKKKEVGFVEPEEVKETVQEEKSTESKPQFFTKKK